MSPQSPVQIILGTHTIGDSTADQTASFNSEAEVKGLLDAFYNRGYRQLDTARDYSAFEAGSSELRLGRAEASSRFTIHTKVHSGHPGDHEAANIELSIAQSLEALGTPTVETMFLHVPDRQTRFEETAKAMNDAFQQGKFKKFGLSNYTAAEVKQFLDICEKRGFVKPSVYQGQYNAVGRGGEKELFPLLREHQMSFFAFSPAAGGFFSGHADTSARWVGDNIIASYYAHRFSASPVQAAVTTMRTISEKYGISAHAAAIRWTAFHGMLDGEYGDALIFGVSKLEQLHKTLDALEAGPLPSEAAKDIDAIYATLEGCDNTYHL